MATTPELLRVARDIQQRLLERRPLAALAARAGMSPFRLQREFVRLGGESPAQYARRLRLLLAATQLLKDGASLQRVARRSGFASPELLIRNFRRAFGCTPAELRRRLKPMRRNAPFMTGLHRLHGVAPCFPFFHAPSDAPRRPAPMPLLSTTLRELAPQPSLIIRSRVPRSEIAATIGQSLGRIVPYALGRGGAFAGQPFSRYPEVGPGSLTIEAGMPLVNPVDGDGEIESLTLPGGPAAVAVHGGGYETMHETYAALERWIAEQGRQPAGPPWEVYVTDPANHPDPADWRTEIYWPVR